MITKLIINKSQFGHIKINLIFFNQQNKLKCRKNILPNNVYEK